MKVDELTRGDYKLTENLEDEASVYEWYREILKDVEYIHEWRYFILSLQDAPQV